MDIGIILLDIIAAFGMFVSLFMLWTMMTFTESGGCVPGYIAIFIITILTFILLRSIRYPIVLFSVGIFLVYYTFVYLTITRPRKQLQKAHARYYGEQLHDQLKGHIIVPIELYGKHQIPNHPESTEVYLFISNDHYDAFIQNQPITHIQWKFITLTGKVGDKDYPDTLFIALVLDRDNNPSIVLPIWGGQFSVDRETNALRVHQASYAWSLGLAYHYHDAAILLYPLHDEWRKPMQSFDNAPTFFQDHVKTNRHRKLDVPSVDLEECKRYFDDAMIQRITKIPSVKKEKLAIYRYREQQDVIHYARQLSQYR